MINRAPIKDRDSAFKRTDSGRGESTPTLGPAPTPTSTEKVTALYDFEKRDEREISFSKGDIMTLINTVSDDWLEVQLGDEKGFIPRAYVQTVTTDLHKSPSPIDSESSREDTTETDESDEESSSEEDSSEEESSSEEMQATASIANSGAPAATSHQVGIASYTFNARSQFEISCFKGERIVILGRDGSWFEGQNSSGRIGWVPASYVAV